LQLTLRAKVPYETLNPKKGARDPESVRMNLSTSLGSGYREKKYGVKRRADCEEARALRLDVLESMAGVLLATSR
jgi:hypothetical protein